MSRAIPPGLPVVRASRLDATLYEGDERRALPWGIAPSVRPDVYVVRQVRDGKRLVLRTDLDSIAFVMRRGDAHEFVVVLPSGDSAWTRITTVDEGAMLPRRSDPTARRTVDTIPIRVGRDGKMYVRASIDGSDTLDLMFDTGSNRVVLSAGARRKGVRVAAGGSELNGSFGGTQVVRTGTVGRLTIGGLTWARVPVTLIDHADGDGIVGYPLFAGRQLQVDVPGRRLLVHESRATLDTGFVPVPTRFDGALFEVAVRVAPAAAGDSAPAWLILDSGASAPLIMMPPNPGLPRILASGPRLGTRTSRGLGPARIRTTLVAVPRVDLGTIALRDVPVDVADVAPYGMPRHGILGMELLRRVDLVIDLVDYEVLARRNADADSPWHAPTELTPVQRTLLVALGVLALLAVVLLVRRTRARRAPGVSSSDS